MRTTPEQRSRWKEKRRMAGWWDLTAKYHRKIRNSQRALLASEKFLAELQHHPFLTQIQQAIREAN